MVDTVVHKTILGSNTLTHDYGVQLKVKGPIRHTNHFLAYIRLRVLLFTQMILLILK